jgi:hypothetical protein
VGRRRHPLKHIKETAVLPITRLIALASLLLAALTATAQIAPGRTWPELKEAVT